ncbi:membrane protein [Streptomyces purpurascens]
MPGPPLTRVRGTMHTVNADSRRVTRSVPSRLAVPAGVLTAVAAAFAYVGTVDPNEPGHYPVCPLLHYTGLYCPGCGGLRSAHAFVHGDFAAAFQDNALAVLGYLGFAVLWTVWVVHAVRGRPLRIDPRPAQVWSLGALLLVFTVVRNLPFGGWLHP